MGKNRSKVGKKKPPRSKSLSRTESDYRTNQMISVIARDFVNFKISSTQDSLDMKEGFVQLRRECSIQSVIANSLLKLLSDVLNMPHQIIVNRFATYMSNEIIVSQEGVVNGDIEIIKYNLS